MAEQPAPVGESREKWLTDALDMAAAELVRLRAENERLRDVDAKRFALFQARNDEIERLRAALQQIVDGADTGWSAIGIARRAIGDET